MKTKILSWIALLFVFAAANPGYANASVADYTLTLRYGGNVSLTQAEAHQLYSNVIALLKTSNFNSSQPKTESWVEYQPPGVQNDYKWTTSGNYLTVSLKEEQTIKTVGGKVNVKEIIVGLNNGRGRNELFTIDGQGHMISHGKYSCPLWIKLSHAANKIAQ